MAAEQETIQKYETGSYYWFVDDYAREHPDHTKTPQELVGLYTTSLAVTYKENHLPDPLPRTPLDYSPRVAA